MFDNAKVETLGVRGTKIRKAICPSDTYSEGGAGAVGGESEYLSGGIAGTSGEGTSQRPSLLGGILAQLIDDAEDRLGKAQECIGWYQREVEELQARLEKLKRLRQLED